MIVKALIASAVGGLLCLDRFQVFQTMISRPMVSAPIIGWVAGDLSAGFASGLLFELLWLRQPPVGGYVPPDATMASIATAAVSGLARADVGMPLTGIVCLTFLFMFPVAFLAVRLDHSLRAMLGRLARTAEAAQKQGRGPAVYLYLIEGLGLGFLTAFVFLCPIVLAGALVLSRVAPFVPPSVARALGVAYFTIPLLGIADLLVALDEREDIILFVIGFAISMGAVLILGARI